MLNYKITKKTTFFKAGVFFVLMVFMVTTVFPPSAFANTGLLGLPNPGVMVPLSPGFAPAMLRGIKIYPNNPLKFDFILDSGDTGLKGEALKTESEKLIKYFLASLTISDEDLWVNLSPYEKDRIIPNKLGATEMGRDMLAQDYLLKQITASLISPEDEFGKKFWDKVYKKAYEQYGTTDIPVDTFNKVWIVPQKAVVYENGDRALVVESKLKVMLEEDYLATQESHKSQAVSPQGLDFAGYSGQLTDEMVREIIIPELEREVNEGKNFAPLRQIYSSLILAYWFKNNLKDAILNKVYTNKGKVRGVDVEDKEITQRIYDQYLAAFKKGVCDIIKIEYDKNTQQNIPRKYFSGGFNMMLDNSDYLVGAILSDDQEDNLASLAAKDRFSFIESEVKQFGSSNLLKKEVDRIDVETTGQVPSGLIGKVYSEFYTGKGFPLLEEDILIEEHLGNRVRITLRNRSKIYDKEGNEINFIEFGDKASDLAKEIYIRDIRDLIERKNLTGVDLEVAMAISEYLAKQDVYFLKENSYNIKGLHNIEKNRIYLNKDIFSAIGLFHEAGEGFLRTIKGEKFLKKLKRDDISIHRYLRGARSDERRKLPLTFYQGLQDLIFGSIANQVFTDLIKGVNSLDKDQEGFDMKGRAHIQNREKSAIVEQNEIILREINELRLSYKSDSPHGVRSRITFKVAKKYFEMKRYDDAIKFARRAKDIGMDPGHDSIPVRDIISMNDFIARSERALKKEGENNKGGFPFSIPDAGDIFAIQRIFYLLGDDEKIKLFSYFYEIADNFFDHKMTRDKLKASLTEEQKDFLAKMYVDLDHIVVTFDDEVYIPFRFGAVIKISREIKKNEEAIYLNRYEAEPYTLAPVLFENFLYIYRKNVPRAKVVLDFGAGEGEKTVNFYDNEYGTERRPYIIANDVNENFISDGLKKYPEITFIKQDLGETAFYASGNYAHAEEVLFDHITFLSLPETSGYSEENLLDYINRCRWSLPKGGKIDVVTKADKVVKILEQWDFKENRNFFGKRYSYVVDIPLKEKEYYRILNDLNTDFTWKSMRDVVGGLLRDDLGSQYSNLVKESVDSEFSLKNVYFEKDSQLNFYEINIVRIKAFIREKLGLPVPPVLLLKFGKDGQAYILRGRHKAYMEAKRGRETISAFIIDLGSDQNKFAQYPRIKDLYVRYNPVNPNISNSIEFHNPKIVYSGKDTGSEISYDYSWTRYAEVADEIEKSVGEAEGMEHKREIEASSEASLENLAKDLEQYIFKMVKSFNLSEVKEMLEETGDILASLKEESRGNRVLNLLSSINKESIKTDTVTISAKSFDAIRNAIGETGGVRAAKTIDFPSEGFSIVAAEAASSSLTAEDIPGDSRMNFNQAQAPGGIDFDADGFEIEARGKGIALDISEIDITALSQAEGFVPIIINIVPITNFNMLMGLNEEGGKEDEILSLTRLDDATVKN